MSARPSEKVAVVGTVDPDAATVGTLNTDWIMVYSVPMRVMSFGSA